MFQLSDFYCKPSTLDPKSLKGTLKDPLKEPLKIFLASTIKLTFGFEDA